MISSRIVKRCAGIFICLGILSIVILQLLIFKSPVSRISVNPLNLEHLHGKHENLPTIYMITPTYARFVQKPELVRLSQTLMLVPSLHWILIEDSARPTDLITKFIKRLETTFGFERITHLFSITPDQYKLKKGEGPSWKYPKGIWQRNKALEWLRENFNRLDPEGVVYFADDDNTYDLELFQEVRSTKGVSIWPVGLAGGLLVEKPLVEQGRVVGFNSMWKSERPFPIDMAGFAISLKLLLNRHDVKFSASQPIGFVESHFLRQLVNSWQDLEPKAESCSRVLVWHTKSQSPALHEERKLNEKSYNGMDWL